MKIEVLMSTMNKQSIEDLKLEERNIFGDVVIINETNKDWVEEAANNIKMISINGIGTSLSRNLAIENASGDISIIADDDIKYVPDYRDIVERAFDNNPEADIITFQIATPDMKPFKANYLEHEQWHNLRTALKCASIEIAFRTKKIKESGLRLNMEFGLGSRYRIHDDVIFVSDAIKMGLKVKYMPIPIVIHPEESSGTVFNDFHIRSKGAALYHIFGAKSYILDILFAIKKYNVYKKDCSFAHFVKTIIKGGVEYCRTH